MPPQGFSCLCHTLTNYSHVVSFNTLPHTHTHTILNVFNGHFVSGIRIGRLRMWAWHSLLALFPVHFSNEARGGALSRSSVVSRTYGGGGPGAEYNIVLNRLRAENILSTTMPMLCSL